MAFDEELADRIRAALATQLVHSVEKRMMGGLCFMVDGKMCLGIVGQQLMARIDPEVYETALKRPGCSPMDFTGRPLRGFVFVNASGIKTSHQLTGWVELALEFNPRARASTKKRKKSGRGRRD